MEQRTFAAIAAHDSAHRGLVHRLITMLGVDGAERFARDRHLDGLVREIKIVAAGKKHRELAAH